jgi:arylsulfatase A-like enzyme
MKRTLVFLLVTAFLILETGAREKLPNIILIVSDDQGYADLSFSSYAGEYVKTPNIDELARSGMFFTDAHTSGMICAPTRAGLLTGRYQQRLGYWVGGHTAGVSAEEIMIPEYLKKKKYVSGMFGKWHVGSAHEEWYPGAQGFDTFYGFLGHGAHSYWDLDIPEDPAELYNAIRTNDGPVNDRGYLTHRITGEVIKFIEANKSAPFFAYVCYNAVHWPHEAPHKDVKLFRSNEIPVGRQILMAMLKNLDDGVGKIIKHLKENGLYKNTMIIFLSDNGGAPNMLADNTPLKNFKNSAYEGGHRVPFMVSWPGYIEAGSTSEALVSSLDILPTILDVTGIEFPEDLIIDGMSLLPVLLQKRQSQHYELFWHGANQRMAYRKGDWKWGYDRGNEFLYNLREDISEENNMLDSLSVVADEMKKRFGEWLSQMSQPDRGSVDWPLETIDDK